MRKVSVYKVQIRVTLKTDHDLTETVHVADELFMGNRGLETAKKRFFSLMAQFDTNRIHWTDELRFYHMNQNPDGSLISLYPIASAAWDSRTGQMFGDNVNLQNL